MVPGGSPLDEALAIEAGCEAASTAEANARHAGGALEVACAITCASEKQPPLQPCEGLWLAATSRAAQLDPEAALGAEGDVPTKAADHHGPPKVSCAGGGMKIRGGGEGPGCS